MHRNSEKFVISHTNKLITVVISMFSIRYERAVSCYKNSHLIGNINAIAVVKVKLFAPAAFVSSKFPLQV